MNIIRIVIPFATILLVVIPSLLIMSLNTKKGVRYKQFRFSAVAFLYSFLCCILFHLLGKLTDFILDLSFVQKFLEWVSPSGKLEYISLVYMAIVLNTALLIGFFIIKGIAKVRVEKKVLPQKLDELPIITKVYWKFIDIFYDISSGKGCLRRPWVKVSVTLKIASWILCAVYITLLVFLQIPVFMNYEWIPYEFMKNCAAALYIWPVISFIVINEFRWFLDGKREYSKQTILAIEHSDIKTIAEYGELAEQYKEQFPERFTAYCVANGKGQTNNFHNDIKAESELEKAIKEQLVSRGYTASEKYLSCIRQLSKGKNALIDAPLFSDFGEYLFMYLNALLACGDNVLFLCSDDESAEVIDLYITEKFKAINSFHPLWIIRSGSEARGATDADILVLTPQSILDDNIFIGQTQFLDNLSTVVIVNSAEVMAKDGELLALLIYQLTNLIRTRSFCRDLQYICLSESVPPETSSCLKELLNLHNELYLSEGYQIFDNTHLMLWNYESNNSDALKTEKERMATLAQDNLFGNNIAQTYWGVLLPIACVGMKYKVKKICVISKQSGPNLQIINSMKTNINRLSQYFGADCGYIDFDNTIILNSVDSLDEHSSFIIVEDELFNLPLAIYNYCRFGGTDTTMIHIVSKPYMLRDYFMANASDYINNESPINMIIPLSLDSTRTVVIKILCEASKNGLEEKELIKRISTINPEVSDIDMALDYCRCIAFPGHEHEALERFFLFKTKVVFNYESASFENVIYIFLKVDFPLKKIIYESRHAKIDIRGKYFELGVFANRLFQYYVPSQCIVFKGTLYKITDIDSKNGIVKVIEASDSLDSPIDYIQVRKYTVSGEAKLSERVTVPLERNDGVASDGYEVKRFRAEVRVDTSAYYALESSSPRLDLANTVAPRELSEATCSLMQREYKSADIISIRIINVGSDKSDKATFLLAVIFNEMMKTLFPYSYKCLAVCPVLNDSQSIYNNQMGGKIANAYPQVEFNTEIEHHPEDIEVLLIEDCPTDTGVLNALLRDGQFPFRKLFNYVLNYLKWFQTFKCTGNITNKYLYFGSDTFPECFDVETLIQVFKDYETVIRIDPKIVDHVTSKGQCSYCYRDLFNVEYKEINDKAGKNNRKLCSECAKLIVTDENELIKLYKKTRKYLCETFGIELPNNISVSFATAEKIRKRLKTEDKRIVLGFVLPSSRELWVESDAPSTNVMDVLAHELTHIWQTDNITMSDREYIEGHASYVEVQYMRHERRKVFADLQEASLLSRQDEYGKGFRRIRTELENRGDTNSFSYMLELFGEGGTGRPSEPDEGKGGGKDGGSGTDGAKDGGKDNAKDGKDKSGDKSSDTDEISRTNNSATKYAYELLDENGKRLYTYLKQEIMAFHTECIIAEPIYNRTEICKILDYINRDSPEIFWLGKSNTLMTNSQTGIVTSVIFTYCMTKQTAVNRQKRIDDALKPFYSSINSSMSDYSVVLNIFETIISLVDYDSLGLDESNKEPNNKKPDDLRSIYGVFVKKKAVCAGYAKATQYLLNKFGIECVYITGISNNGISQNYHAWNLLKLEGDYYYLDTTWGDYSNTDDKKSHKGINYSYFCITTEELEKNHKPDEDFPVPICTATKCSYKNRGKK